MIAAKIFAVACEASDKALIGRGCLPQPSASQSTLSTVLTIVFTIIGALAFLMLVIAGFRFVISSGQPEKVAEARRQIIYAFVGLLVAALAAVIVNFVIGRV